LLESRWLASSERKSSANRSTNAAYRSRPDELLHKSQPPVLKTLTRYGIDIHGIENADDDETEGAVRVIRIPHNQSDGLANRSSGTESEDQDPGTDATLGIRDSSDTGAQTKTLEHLMEQDGNEQDDETLDGDGDSHADEDGVEQDTAFQQGNVERHLPEDKRVDGLALLIDVWRLGYNHGLALLLRLHLLLASRDGRADHVHHLQALAHVLLVEDDEPRRHLRGRELRVGEERVLHAGARVLVVHALRHLLLNIDIVRLEARPALVARGPLWRGHGLVHRHRRRREVLASRSAVGVTASLTVEPHLDDEEAEHGAHHDDTGHGRVLVREQIRKAWVEQVAEGGGEQLY